MNLRRPVLMLALAAAGAGAFAEVSARETEPLSLRPLVAAGGCHADEVQLALDNASVGDVVAIPAGNCHWGAANVHHAAGIWIKGAGIGLTVIDTHMPPSQNHNPSGFALTLDCANGEQAEVSGISFIGLDDDTVYDVGVHLENGCRDFKVHDMEFRLFSDSGLRIDGGGRGVVYDSRFVDNLLDGLGYGIEVYGNDDWPELVLGDQNAVFIEDNYFKGNRHAIASNNGSRYVARHNTIITTQASRNWAMVDAHGDTSSSGQGHGSRSWEIYENTLIAQGDADSGGIRMRGGDGVIFNNTIDAGIGYTAGFVIESGCPDHGAVQGPAGPYPVRDQTRHAWIWGNVRGGSPTQSIFTKEERPGYPPFNCDYYFQEGRDYFQFAKSEYVPYVYPHPLRSDYIFRNGFD